jgi:DNA modification methylase
VTTQLTAVEHRSPASLRPCPGNARRHSKKQIKQIADSIRRFGFTNPVLIGDDDEIIAGHGRIEAAKLLGLEQVPTLRLARLTGSDRRAYILADNKLALNAGWDQEMLAIELQALIDLDYDVSLTGFSTLEIDLTLDAARQARPEGAAGPEDDIPPMGGVAITRKGEIWRLGRHRLLCGDARSGEDYVRLMDGASADLIFADPPYNVPIDGYVSGHGRVRHREFAMGVGEMSEAEFTQFLTETLGQAAKVCKDGAIAFVCMDWRHLGEVLAAGKTVFTELKNICVWNKTIGGLGAFYRSKHEMVLVFKTGHGPHVNTFGGKGGRYRTNVWDYPGVASLGGERDESLAMHPTVKPVALVADAIRDCSHRGEIVLDPFAGSGTTLIAAETCGRTARVIEFDPFYCDTIVRRFQALTGKAAMLLADGREFDVVEAERLAEAAA